MVEQGKRQLLKAWTKGELRKGGDAPSLHWGGGAAAPAGKSASAFVGGTEGGGGAEGPL